MGPQGARRCVTEAEMPVYIAEEGLQSRPRRLFVDRAARQDQSYRRPIELSVGDYIIGG